MKSETLRVTLIQSNLHWENKEANMEMFAKKINSIEEETDLILLPEMFTTGFSMKTSLAENENGKTIEWMKEVARKKNCIICGSIIFSSFAEASADKEEFYNRLIWMKPDGNFSSYNKKHLFGLGEENKFYTAGNERIIVELNGWKICPLICYDLRFPVWSRQQHNNLYDVLLYVANWPERRSGAWKKLLPARAIENQAYTIGLNRVGEDGNKFNHSGDSMVVDARGEILFHSANEEKIFSVELKRDELERTQKELPFLNDADEFTLQT